MSSAHDGSADARGLVTSVFDARSTAEDVARGHELFGKVAIVTGGASGIGTETARVLAHAGAEVVIAARNIAAAQHIADDINQSIGANRVTVQYLELADLASVRDFAAAWRGRPLNLLINNAGIMGCPQGTTKDGFERQFGVNHLGHFLLANLLIDSLAAGAPARVISLSSRGHMLADVDFDDLNFERRAYQPMVAYGQSKTANALFAVEFDRRYHARGIRAYSVMPGMIATALERHMTDEIYTGLGIKPLAERDATHMKSIPQGAATTLWAALAPELEGHGGLYLEDCREAAPFAPGQSGPTVLPRAIDPDRARLLWDVSEKAVGLMAAHSDI